MSKQTIEKTSGVGDVVEATSAPVGDPPAARTTNNLWHSQIRWIEDPRPGAEESGPRASTPYWEVSIYSNEEIAAIREADKLDPLLAEYYGNLLDD